MAIGSGSDRLMSDINVTPFVDVMLVLLIIFMVTAPMMVQGVDVALPEVSAKPMVTEKENLTVTIDGRPTFISMISRCAWIFSKTSWRRSLREKRTGRFFSGGQRRTLWRCRQVMAEIKAAGVDRLGMVTDPFDDTSPVTVPVKKADEKEYPRSGVFQPGPAGRWAGAAVLSRGHLPGLPHGFSGAFRGQPSLRSERPQARSVINVSMVSFKNPATEDHQNAGGKQGPPNQKARGGEKSGHATG
jgi:biopolymer transport protein TolR